MWSPALRARSLAVDVGTCGLRVWVPGRGLVVDEPTVLALDEVRGTTAAFGRAAIELAAAASGDVILVRPIQAGVVVDEAHAARLLTLALTAAEIGSFTRSRLMLCIPAGATAVESRALCRLLADAGSSTVVAVRATLAAAAGAGLPVDEPYGSMVMDVGGGCCAAAVVALGEVVTQAAVRRGGDDFARVVAARVRARHDVLLGLPAADGLVRRFGVGSGRAGTGTRVTGRRLVDGVATEVLVTGADVHCCVSEIVADVTDLVAATLGQCRPELVQDVVEGGLHLTGGGALLPGLDAHLVQATGLAVSTVTDPRTATIRGAAALLERDGS